MDTAIANAIEHDTRLLELLQAVAVARGELDTVELRLKQAAAKVRVDYNGRAVESRPDGAPKLLGNKESLPVGTIYYQEKTFTRGEEGFWQVVPVPAEAGRPEKVAHRRLSATDVLERAINEDIVPEAVLNAHEAAYTRYSDALDAVRAHEEGYTGWNRFFLVTSSAGHVHRSMSCSTCLPTTTYAPVVSLSGTSDAEAVEALGSTLCTVCFPDAPVSGKVTKLTKAQAAKIIAEGVTEDTTCPGSGTYNYDRATARLGYVSGNRVTCNECGRRVTATATNKIRRHDRPGA